MVYVNLYDAGNKPVPSGMYKMHIVRLLGSTYNGDTYEIVDTSSIKDWICSTVIRTCIVMITCRVL